MKCETNRVHGFALYTKITIKNEPYHGTGFALCGFPILHFMPFNRDKGLTIRLIWVELTWV
jgi:hypothetical protein